MTDLAQRIYKILSPQEDFISVKSLAASLGLKDRDLRGKNGEPGILRTASKEIFIASGKCIIKRMSKPSGVKLTDDPAEIKGARKQWSEFTHHASEILTDCDFYLRILEQQTKPKEPDLFKQEAA